MASQNTGSGSSTSLGSLFDSDDEENSAPSLPTTEADRDTEEPDSFWKKRSYLLTKMSFSKQEVDLAVRELGEGASIDQLVNWIVTAQEAKTEGNAEFLPAQMDKPHSLLQMGFTQQEVSFAIEAFGQEAKVEELADAILARRIANNIEQKEETAELLPEVMDKPLSLLKMGFNKEEVSAVIAIFGEEATVEELADSIFARRFSNTTEQKKVKIESEFPDETETGYSTSRLRFYDDEDDANIRCKKAKHAFGDDRRASSSQNVNQSSRTPWLSRCSGSIANGSLKDEGVERTSSPGRNIHGDLVKPPFFIYASLVDITKETWNTLSSFLFNVQPEYLNSQSFSALTRREGYIHNLPTEGRHVAVPSSPMTIRDALPLTRQFCPSWDTRKRIDGVGLDVAGTEQIRAKLEKAMRDSRGILSEVKQAQIVQQCKTANLVWIGQGKLGPLQPHQMEAILGYPANHTDLPGIDPHDKVASLRYALQTDTMAYILSVLKDRYPDGLRVLSIFSGVGGAEVALHRLGIPLRCVVSVEESVVNRRVLKRWWGETQQNGKLRQLDRIQKLDTKEFEALMKEFGGFDLIVGGNYGLYRGAAMTVGTAMGMDTSRFFEYVRIVQMVRRKMQGIA
ncbi:probable inactive DNA (cytosine-5)-methyltransferase DRM3 [Triticum dicoccoides]|uniref:probable inactive DNA (cytosine-5)-methyltransferase DRM3 n=1 Tax=Triticum dicoccoides TaxID=85692 RepID=UPI000E7A5F6D|nr:probable inactive DNA (cytosine-5)-methyltransferase DRM3 [Triticum dicoccoides]